MNRLEPVKGAFYRRFQPSSYKENDGKAKRIVINYLERNVIRRDCEFAWRIKDYQMTQECIKEIWLGNVGRKEHFFHIPYGEAELVNLKDNV
jgi:hypothetical protein